MSNRAALQGAKLPGHASPCRRRAVGARTPGRRVEHVAGCVVRDAVPMEGSCGTAGDGNR